MLGAGASVWCGKGSDRRGLADARTGHLQEHKLAYGSAIYLT